MLAALGSLNEEKYAKCVASVSQLWGDSPHTRPPAAVINFWLSFRIAHLRLDSISKAGSVMVKSSAPTNCVR